MVVMQRHPAISPGMVAFDAHMCINAISRMSATLHVQRMG
jgi:hypothetical protein